VFADGAIELLGRRCLERSVRECRTDVRDAFDHQYVPPGESSETTWSRL